MSTRDTTASYVYVLSIECVPYAYRGQILKVTHMRMNLLCLEVLTYMWSLVSMEYVLQLTQQR
jgi:hypothetical protein